MDNEVKLIASAELRWKYQYDNYNYINLKWNGKKFKQNQLNTSTK